MLPRQLLGPLLLAAAAFAPLLGCASVHDLHYVPAPLEVAITDEATPELSGRALVTVAAVRRADRSEGRPAQFELVMRLENLGEIPFSIDRESVQLVTADLEALGPAQITPAPPEVAPQGAVRLKLVFPVDDGIEKRDLSGLNLRWAVLFEGRQMFVGAGFHRAPPPRAYYDPCYPYSSSSWRVGVGYFDAY